MTAPIASPAPAATGSAPPSRAELTRIGNAFEAILLRQMLGAAQAARLDDGALSSEPTRQFEAMQMDALADALAPHLGADFTAALVAQFGGRR